MKKIIFTIFTTLTILVTVALGFFYSKKSGSENARTTSSSVNQSQKNSDEVLAHSAITDSKINILFVGDMMFDRWIRQTSQNKNNDFTFQKVHDLLQKQDLVVGNLEGPITDSPSISIGSAFGSRENYIFTFPPETAQKLYAENIRMVSIGNNHILNFQENGLSSTKKHLTDSHVDFFGDTGENIPRFSVRTIKGLRIAFVNYNQFAANSKQNALDDLQTVQNERPDFTVVYTHWGTEFADIPNEKDRELAHRFISAGADILIGSHPHVRQSKETYRGKTIYYSLGNFIFDQYFDQRTQTGLAVQVGINPADKRITTQEYSVKMGTNGQTSLE